MCEVVDAEEDWRACALVSGKLTVNVELKMFSKQCCYWCGECCRCPRKIKTTAVLVSVHCHVDSMSGTDTPSASVG